MIREKIIAWLRAEQKKMAPMSPRKKWEYIWTYYKWWILGTILLVCIIVTGVQDAQYQQRQPLISGIFINTGSSDEGYAFVKDGYWTFTGADPDTRVELVEARSIRFNLEQPTGIDVELIMSVDTLVAAGDLDYIIGDTTALEFYDRRENLLDLSQILTAEQLAQLNVVTTESGIVAIDLTGSALEEQFGLYTKPSYIMVLANTPHRAQCADFIQYLFKN